MFALRVVWMQKAERQHSTMNNMLCSPEHNEGGELTWEWHVAIIPVSLRGNWQVEQAQRDSRAGEIRHIEPPSHPSSCWDPVGLRAFLERWIDCESALWTFSIFFVHKQILSYKSVGVWKWLSCVWPHRRNSRNFYAHPRHLQVLTQITSYCLKPDQNSQSRTTRHAALFTPIHPALTTWYKKTETRGWGGGEVVVFHHPLKPQLSNPDATISESIVRV